MGGHAEGTAVSNGLTTAARLSAQVERPGSRRVTRIGAAGACGGALTVYLAGCNLKCIHCWAGPDREDPEGTAWMPWAELQRRIQCYRRENRLNASSDRVRLSGGEPVLGERFFDLLEALLVLPGRVYVETNGVVLGAHPAWCERLAGLRERVILKVSLKAGTPEQFERLTGCSRIAWESAWTAVEALHRSGAAFDLNALTRAPELFTSAERAALLSRLEETSPELVGRLEEEALTPYPGTVRRMAGSWH
jgi:uncharacterized Fe-S cluster-containing radical SAM superfamily protein